MKLIHLSDLHLGKRVNEISMLEDQSYILDQILSIIQAEAPQAVLIAGDVYDKTVPSAEAVSLFDRFLFRLSRLDAQVMIVSGNHDSAERLSFGGRLIDSAGIHLSPVYDGQIRPVVLTDEHGPVYFWLLPFLRPVHVRRFFPEETIGSYTDACRVAIGQMGIDPAARNVLVAHQFVTGGATCDSEELSIGTADNVDAQVFRDFDYVALGHLHGPQNIGSERLRYCGTPLKYSFSECHHRKSVTIVDLGGKGQLNIRTKPLVPRRDLRQLRGSFDQLTDRRLFEGTATGDYLQIILTDEEEIPNAMARLRQVYPHALKLTYDNTRTRADQAIDGAVEVERKDPIELFEELYQQQNNQPMTRLQRDFVRDLFRSIQEDHVCDQ